MAIGKEGTLLVGSGGFPASRIDEFGSAASGNAFLRALVLNSETGPASLAVEDSSSQIFLTGAEAGNTNTKTPYVETFTGEGALIARWAKFGRRSHVAVDNASNAILDPSACSPTCVTYVSHEAENPASPNGDGAPRGIQKFSASGAPLPFTNAKGEATKLPYVSGNEIIDVPETAGGCTRPLGSAFGSPGAIAVDPHGDIFVIDEECAFEAPAIIEYAPSGEFIRRILGAEGSPGIDENHENSGFGGIPEGIAFDPVTGHILVGITQYIGGEVEGAPTLGAVDEFDPATGAFIGQITEDAAGEVLKSAFDLAVDDEGDLYVADPLSNRVDTYAPGHFVPTVRLGEAVQRTGPTAVLLGSVDPEGLTMTDCHFEYVSHSAFIATGFTNLSSGGSVACDPAAAEISPTGGFAAVKGTITGLVTGREYEYRLIAESGGELGGVEASPPLAFTAPAAPELNSAQAKNVTSTSAILKATINPVGAATTYDFEYIDDVTFRATGFTEATKTPAANVGDGGPTGSSSEKVEQVAAGLTPSTLYHFRVHATNSFGDTVGLEGQFETLPEASVGLPEGRGYELVTPARKEGGSDMFGATTGQSEFLNPDVTDPANSGQALLLETHAGFGPFPGSEASAYVFRRNANALRWEFTSLADPALGVQNVAPAVFAPEFSQVGVNINVGSSAGSEGARDFSLIGPPGSEYTTLHLDSPFFGKGPATEVTKVVGASENLSDVVLQQSGGAQPLCPGAAAQKHGEILCEWTDGVMSLVNSGVVNSCGAKLGLVTAQNAVSTSGEEVIFTDPDPAAVNAGPGCWNGGTTNAPQLYAKVGSQTVEVSAPETGVVDPTGRHVAEYVGASPDGSRVYFLTETWLTADHPNTHDLELYECALVGPAGEKHCVLSRVSGGAEGTPGRVGGAGVFSVPAISGNGGVVYFAAFGSLTTGAPQLAPPPKLASGEEGPLNIYRYDAETHAIAAVTEVETGDFPSNGPCAQLALFVAQSRIPCWKANWYSNPSGDDLLFGTTRKITSYDPASASRCETPGTQGAVNGRCTELYRYDSSDSSVTCVSCDPSGEAPISNALFDRSAPSGPSAGPVRAMSDDGSTIVFDTADPLVATDGNGTLDVYQWHDGVVSLISSGRDAGPSFFLGMSSNASDIFIGTHSRLTSADTDTSGDIYDARICGAGSPCIGSFDEVAPSCEGDACQHPPAAPVDATPNSETFSAPGANSPVAPTTGASHKKATRRQLLSRALRSCRAHIKKKPRREHCEAAARKRFSGKSGKR